MKRMLITGAIMILALTLGGCMHSSQRGTSSSLVDYLYPNGEAVNHGADQVPHLNLPLRVGIAFVPEQNTLNTASLGANEKQALLQKVAQKFRAENYIQSIEIIPELYMRQGKGFQTVSQIARLHGLDVMALVSYDQVTVSDENLLALTYWTILGAYIFPGETTRTSVFVDTAVFEVNSKKLLFRAPGMASDERLHSAVGGYEAQRYSASKSFNLAVDQMSQNLAGELSAFKTRVKNEKVATVSYRKGYSGGGSAAWYGLVLLLLLLIYNRQPKQ